MHSFFIVFSQTIAFQQTQTRLLTAFKLFLSLFTTLQTTFAQCVCLFLIFETGGGGAALERLALEGDENSIPFPVPLKHRKDCMFSFSGLKTAVFLACQKLGDDKMTRRERGKYFKAKRAVHRVYGKHL